MLALSLARRMEELRSFLEGKVRNPCEKREAAVSRRAGGGVIRPTLLSDFFEAVIFGHET